MEFKKLFSPIKIQNLELRNRIVMLPVSTGFAEPDGTVGDRLIDFYAARAKGGAGLIDIPFSPMQDGGHAEPGLFDDRFIPGIRNLTSCLHAYGAKVSAQLVMFYSVVFKDNTAEVVGPSPVFNKMMHCVPRALTTDEIHTIVSEYGKAARRARQGGFDAVEVLVGAGYLLNRFLSPTGNERTDDYGGSLENRMRIILEIIESIKQEAGRDFPIFCRLNVEEQMPPKGHTIENSKEALRILEKNGVAMIIVYTGWHESPTPTVAPHLPKGNFAYLSQKIKEYIDLPVVASNRINDPFTAEQILLEGKADLIGMARALLADPELPKKAFEGRIDEINPCMACSECLAQVMGSAKSEASGVQRSLCSVNPIAGKEGTAVPKLASRKKKTFIIGAGPAGINAAIAAKEGGHDVTVFEKGSGPGGRLLLAALPPYKDQVLDLVKSLYVRALKAGAIFKFDADADPQWIAEQKPDVLIVASGAETLIPPIPGINGANVVLAEDVLTGCKPVQGTVIVIGGGMVGCETAEFLFERGASHVTVVEMLGRLANNIAPTYRPFFLGRLKKAGIKMETDTTVSEITEKGIHVIKKDGSGEFIPGDTVVLAAGYKADPQKIESFKGAAAEVFSIGDCVKARMIKDAVEEGFLVGNSI